MLERNNPETITNAMINNLGKKYLDNFPEPTSVHNSHSVAKALLNYNEGIDSRQKWMFLADQYSILRYDGKLGSLANNIMNLFTEAFSGLRADSKIPYKSIYEPVNRYYNALTYTMLRQLHEAKTQKLNAGKPANETGSLYASLTEIAASQTEKQRRVR